MEKLLFTPEEAARFLSVGRTKVYELIATGQLRSVRIGTCRRISPEALSDFVALLQGGARNAPPETPEGCQGRLRGRPEGEP
jgi:excisionase family DNA binding protein